MYKAYEDLEDTLKEEIKNLRVVHDHEYIINLSKELSTRKNKGNYDKLDPVIHPLVRRHPITKKPSLFLSPHTMVKICLLYTSPSPRDRIASRMPSSA